MQGDSRGSACGPALLTEIPESKPPVQAHRRWGRTRPGRSQSLHGDALRPSLPTGHSLADLSVGSTEAVGPHQNRVSYKIEMGLPKPIIQNIEK